MQNIHKRVSWHYSNNDDSILCGIVLTKSFSHTRTLVTTNQKKQKKVFIIQLNQSFK